MSDKVIEDRFECANCGHAEGEWLGEGQHRFYLCELCGGDMVEVDCEPLTAEDWRRELSRPVSDFVL